MTRINDGQFLARLGVVRMLLQVLYKFGCELFRIGFFRTQKFAGSQQTDVPDAFRNRHCRPVMRRPQDLLGAAQVRDALRRLRRQRGFRKPGDDLLQHGPRGIHVLRDLPDASQPAA